MAITTKYKNSPLIETICEFHYIHKEQWDATLPGMLYESVKEEYPVKNQRKDFYQPPGMIDEGLNNLTVFTQFYNEKKESLIQIGKNVLTINCLKPYPHWEFFKPMILKNSGIYREIAKPISLRQLSLRYINKINIPINDGEKVSLKEYFKYYPNRPEELKGDMSSIDIVIHLPHNEDRDALILRLATVLPDEEKQVSFLLQLDFIMVKPEQLPLDNLEEWLENAHSIINSTFELSITDKCKALFN